MTTLRILEKITMLLIIVLSIALILFLINKRNNYRTGKEVICETNIDTIKGKVMYYEDKYIVVSWTIVQRMWYTGWTAIEKDCVWCSPWVQAIEYVWGESFYETIHDDAIILHITDCVRQDENKYKDELKSYKEHRID
jgi:hypothetical protein